MTERSEHSKGVIACVILALSYSLFNLFARELAQGLAVLQQVYLRALVGFLLGFIFFPRSFVWHRIIAIPRSDWFLLVIRATLLYLIGVVSFTKAVLLTSIANAGFIVALPYYIVWGVVLFKERISVSKGLALLVGFLGVALIAIKETEAGISWGAGELYALLAGLAFSFGVVTRRFHTDYLSDRELAQLFSLLGFAIVFLAAIYFGEPITFEPRPRLLFILLLAGSCLSLNTFLANFVFLRIGSVLAGNILTLEMLFVLLLGVFFYHEIPDARAWCGGFLVLFGVLAVNRIERVEQTRNS